MAIFPNKSKEFAAVHQTPAGNSLPIAPSDTGGLSASGALYQTRGVYVGQGGHLVVTMAYNSASCKFLSCAAGTILPIRVSRVANTSTTAAGLVALW